MGRLLLSCVCFLALHVIASAAPVPASKKPRTLFEKNKISAKVVKPSSKKETVPPRVFHKLPPKKLPPKLTLSIKNDGESSYLFLHFAKSTPLAVFELNEILYVYAPFQGDIHWDEKALKRSPFFKSVYTNQQAEGTLFSLPLKQVGRIQTTTARTTWKIQISHTSPKNKHTVLDPEVLTTNAHKKSLFLKQLKAHPAHTIQLPQGTAFVVPFGEALISYPSHQTTDYTILPCYHGMAVIPHSKALQVMVTSTGVSLSHPKGLHLSADKKKVPTLKGVASSNFPFDLWRPKTQNWREEQDIILKNIAFKPKSQRGKSRLRLATFYLMTGRDNEAVGALQTAAFYDPDLLNHPQFKALLGIAYLATERPQKAYEVFNHPVFDNDPEMLLLREITQAKVDPAHASLQMIEAHLPIIKNYPGFLKNLLLLAAAELTVHHRQSPDLYLDKIDLTNLKPRHRDQVAFLKAYSQLSRGKQKEALTYLEAINKRPSSEFIVRAALLKTSLYSKEKTLKKAEEIKHLEKLRYAWKGDAQEFNILRRLSYLYIRGQEYDKGFLALYQALHRFPEESKANKLGIFAEQSFKQALCQEGCLSPFQAVSLYREYHSFIPQGPYKKTIRTQLIKDLIDMDLLTQAIALLKDQYKEESGFQKEQTANKLAEIYLRHGNPQKSLKFLNLTPKDKKVRQEQLYLKARAYFDLHDEEGLEKLAKKMPGEITHKVLLSYALHNQNWHKAVHLLKPLVEKNKSPADILNLSICYLLTHDAKALTDLKKQYGAIFENKREKTLFDLITSTDETEDITTKKAILLHLKETQNLESVFKNLKSL